MKNFTDPDPRLRVLRDRLLRRRHALLNRKFGKVITSNETVQLRDILQRLDIVDMAVYPLFLEDVLTSSFFGLVGTTGPLPSYNGSGRARLAAKLPECND